MTLSGRRLAAGLLAAVALAAAAPEPLPAERLTDRVGRSEVRVWGAPFWLAEGLTVTGAALPERLERLGYRRVHRRPEAAGEYFWGHEVFWIWRRAHRWGGRERREELLRLELERDGGRIAAVGSWIAGPDGAGGELRRPRAPWLEPELMAESLSGDRAARVPVRLDDLPEHVWRAVVAVEDARFFRHEGVDPRAVARAALKNALAGKVTQGGSTITQQLIKMRDLSPKRSLGRKVSEAVRALALEAEHSKEEILEAYLDRVYLGHLEGVAVYGYGAGARAWFGRPVEALGLAEAALLAAMIQGPNRLHPVRHPERALERMRHVLSRMRKEGWAGRSEAERAGRALPRLAGGAPRLGPAPHLMAWLAEASGRAAGRRLERGRGVVVESTLDPWLQLAAEEALRDGLAGLRRAFGDRPLSAALVALDAVGGEIVAYVGGDPARRDEFDRVRRARRQPGSAVKPLVLLEAFESCGARRPLAPASRVAAGPLTLELSSGQWRPREPSQVSPGAASGPVDLRTALVDSLNLPFVRVARHCGFGATAERFRRAGLTVPADPPPSFVLGSLEATPLEMAAAFTPIAHRGRRVEPRPVTRVERPGGRGLGRSRTDERKVVSEEAAWLVRDLLAGAVERGTARGARLAAVSAWGKTGTSSEERDAWFVGGAGRLVAAVWVGLDDGAPLGRSGGATAAPLWRAFMERAAGARPAPPARRPPGLVSRWVDPASGRIYAAARGGAQEEPFRRKSLGGLLGWARGLARSVELVE